jgi:hypothetical protein
VGILLEAEAWGEWDFVEVRGECDDEVLGDFPAFFLACDELAEGFAEG